MKTAIFIVFFSILMISALAAGCGVSCSYNNGRCQCIKTFSNLVKQLPQKIVGATAVTVLRVEVALLASVYGFNG